MDAPSPADHDDLTMVIPTSSSQGNTPRKLPLHNRPDRSKTAPTSNGTPSFAEDDGFTMVIPNMKIPPSDSYSPVGSHERTRRSPARPQTELTTVDSSTISPERVNHSKADFSDPPSRRGSPVRQTEEVQVFEDEPVVRPSAPAIKSTPSSPEKTPLEELPINDQGYGRSPTPENGSQAGSPHPVNNNGMSPTPLNNGFGMQTPQDRAESLRARRLLSSGIERIKAHTLDAHGFRRLQELVKSPNADIWIASSGPVEMECSPTKPNGTAAVASPKKGSTNKLADLLLALTSYIELPLSSVSPQQAKAANLKGQALAIATALLVQPYASHPASGFAQVQTSRHIAQATCPRMLCAILRGRKECDDVSHLAAELERTATELVGTCQPVEAIEAVLDVVDSEESSTTHDDGQAEDNQSIDGDHHGRNMRPVDPTGHARIVSTGLDILSQLLRRLKPRDTGDARAQFMLSASLRQKLGQLAVKFLEDSEPDVRRADTDFCVELYDVISRRRGYAGEETRSGAEEFWKVVGSAGEGSLNLITYYLAKRGKT